MTNIKVLIVEDETLVAEDIALNLQNIDFEVAGIAYNSEKALDMLALRHPDAVLLDINIKGTMDGIQLAEIINEKYHLPFIYLTSYSDKATIERAKVTMPYGYIVKPFDERDLLTSLEMAVYRHAQTNKNTPPGLEKINAKLLSAVTKKEYEIALDICQGLTNKQMGEKHFVSVNTIKSHIKNLYLKLEVHHRTALINRLNQL
ncbi:MAG: response regulator transcription factor [Bacteroidota bacterium]